MVGQAISEGPSSTQPMKLLASSIAGLGRWILGAFLSMAIVGVMTLRLVLWNLGVPYRSNGAWSPLAEPFIPKRGPILAAVPQIAFGSERIPKPAL